MKTVIISGGRIERDFALSFLKNEIFDQIIAVDNGLKFLYENQIRPTWIVGDFDTAAPELVEYYQRQTDPYKCTLPGYSIYSDNRRPCSHRQSILHFPVQDQIRNRILPPIIKMINGRLAGRGKIHVQLLVA